MITIQSSVSKGWLHKEGGFHYPQAYYFDPLFRWTQDRAADKFVKDRFPMVPVYNMESNLVQAEHFAARQILIGGIQPNLLLGMAAGAELVSCDDKDADIDRKPFEHVEDAAALPDPESLLDSRIIQMLDSQLETIAGERPDLQAIPPFFWDTSGRATIHGLVTTALKLFGENAFIMMMTQPDVFTAILSWITQAYILLIKHFATIAGMTVTSVHVGECSGAMISSAHFSGYVVPFVNRLGEEFNTVRLHSCGHSDHLIEAISAIRNLSVIDTGSRTSVAKIRSVMGLDFEISIAPPVECLVKTAGEDGILAWLDKTFEDNGGGPLQIKYHIEPDYSMERCLHIFEYLTDRGIPVRRL